MEKLLSKVLIKKDINEIVRNKTLLSTLVIIPIVFSVIIPAALLAAALFFDLEQIAGEDGDMILNAFSESKLGETVAAYTVEQQIVYLFLNYMLPTLFLLVPIITAMVVAANSFVGEKERRTLESLLFSPISIKKLFVSKVLASFLPALFVSFVSFLLAGIVINALGYRLFGELIFPSASWVILITCLSPMVILLAVMINILVSSRVKTYQEAQNIGGVIVLPVIGLLIGQVSGLFIMGAGLILLISLAILLINLVLLQVISRKSDRYQLFEKQIH